MRCRSSISRMSAFCVRLLSVMSRAIFEAPTIQPAAERIGETLSETSTLAAVLVQPQRLELLDRSPRPTRSRMLSHLVAPVRRNDEIDMLADGLVRGISEQPFGGLVPGR